MITTINLILVICTHQILVSLAHQACMTQESTFVVKSTQRIPEHCHSHSRFSYPSHR